MKTFITIFNKGLTKIIHKKTQSHQATPTNQTMTNDHVNGVFKLEDTKEPNQLGVGT
jgi:hypothetical protein